MSAPHDATSVVAAAAASATPASSAAAASPTATASPSAQPAVIADRISNLPGYLLARIANYLPLSDQLVASLAWKSFEVAATADPERAAALETGRKAFEAKRVLELEGSLKVNAKAEIDVIPALMKMGSLLLFDHMDQESQAGIQRQIRSRSKALQKPKPDYVIKGPDRTDVCDAFSANWSPQNQPSETRLTDYARGIVSSANKKATKYGPGTLAVANISSLPAQVSTSQIAGLINRELRGKPLGATLLLFRHGSLSRWDA